MGLPMDTLCAATNENNVFCRFVNEGVLEKVGWAAGAAERVERYGEAVHRNRR